jgi:hypothetical protein
MSELAFNLNGERFDLPATAAHWRVRRMRDVPRGGPEVVFGRDGLPLIIPVDAGTDEFRRYVDEVSGKYRLDPLDDCHQPVPDAPAAYVFVAKGERNSAPAQVVIEAAKLDPRDELLREVVRTNADVTKVMAEKFAGVMEAAAVLLKAADGAGLPARPGMAIVEGEDDIEEATEQAARPAFDLGAVLGQLVPALCLAVGSRGGDAAKAVAAVGQSMRALPAPERPESKPAAPPAAGKKDEASQASATPSTPVDAMAHFLAIQGQLSFDERAFVQGVIGELSLSDLGAWREQLTSLSVDDAVALIRSEIAKGKEKAS